MSSESNGNVRHVRIERKDGEYELSSGDIVELALVARLDEIQRDRLKPQTESEYVLEGIIDHQRDKHKYLM